MDPAAAHATIEPSMQTEKRLFVLRHAKSSWDDPGLDDRDRPLAPRGIRSTKLLAKHVRAQGIEPTQVLCSPSRRTRETLEGVAPGGETLIEPAANRRVIAVSLRRGSTANVWRDPDSNRPDDVPGHGTDATAGANGETRTRTGDTTIFSRVLYQLSYLAVGWRC